VNWTERICKGSGIEFGRVACEHYRMDSAQCALLNQGRIAALCEQGRCTPTIIVLVQKSLSRQFPDLLDECEDLDLQGFTNQLRNMVWQGSRAPARWLSYLREAIKNRSTKILIRERLAPDQKRCGTCRSLPRWKPYTCQVSGEEKRRTDPACDDYHFPGRAVIREPLGGAGEGERGGSPFDGPSFEKSDDVQANVESKIDVERLMKALAERAAAKGLGERDRARFSRQYDLFVRMHRLLGEVDSDKKVINILSEQMSVSERMVRRDIARVREFLLSTAPRP
jgi:hypothetical protein